MAGYLYSGGKSFFPVTHYCILTNVNNMLYYSCDKAAMGLMGGGMERKSGSILDLCTFSLDTKIVLESTRF